MRILVRLIAVGVALARVEVEVDDARSQFELRQGKALEFEVDDSLRDDVLRALIDDTEQKD